MVRETRAEAAVGEATRSGVCRGGVRQRTAGAGNVRDARSLDGSGQLLHSKMLNYRMR